MASYRRPGYSQSVSKKNPRITTESRPLTVNPFAVLGGGNDINTSVETTSPVNAVPAAKQDLRSILQGKVALSKSRKGRGGRTVVVITGLGGDNEQKELLVSDLKRALGCGAVLEDNSVVVQGDQADRVRDHLIARGARQVVMGT